jgi:hypothetical protein
MQFAHADEMCSWRMQMKSAVLGVSMQDWRGVSDLLVDDWFKELNVMTQPA